MSIISCDITPEVVYFWDKECGFIRFYSISFSFIRFHAVESSPTTDFKWSNLFQTLRLVIASLFANIIFTPLSISPSPHDLQPHGVLWSPQMITWSHWSHVLGKGLKDLKGGYGSDVYRTHFESPSSFYNIFVNIKQETWVYKY